MKNLKILKKMLAITLIVLLMFTSSIVGVSAYETGSNDNITISPDVQVNIYNSNSEEIEMTTQATKPTQTQKEDVLSTGNQNIVQLNILNGSIKLQSNYGSTQYQIADGEWTTYTGSVEITSINVDTGNIESTQNTVKVESGTHNIILNNVNIDLSSKLFAYPIDIKAGTRANLTLANNSQNILKSGRYSAGIDVETGATLTINSEEVTGQEQVGKLIAYGGSQGAGIGGGYNNGTGGTIVISGGDITAYGGSYGAGIGGGDYGSAGTITINGGNVKAYGGEGGAGIGGGRRGAGGSVTISNYAQVEVYAKNIENSVEFSYPPAIGAGSYNISEDSKKAGSYLAIGNNAKVTAVAMGNGLAFDSNGSITAPYGEVVANSIQLNFENAQTGKTQLLGDNGSNFEYNSTDTYQTVAFSGVVNAKEYKVLVNGFSQQGNSLGGALITDFVSAGNLTTYNNIKLSEDNKAVSINEYNIYLKANGEETQYSIDNVNWSNYTDNLTIIGTGEVTGNKVTVESGTHNIILKNVNIDVSTTANACAFDVQGSSNVNLKLAKDSVNVLKSGNYKAGIQVQAGATLTLNSEEVTGQETVGNLEVRGGNLGAGIGGGSRGNGGNININDGNVIATGGEYGAGIGGGSEAPNEIVTISGGNITAIGGIYGAGIGGGDGGAGGTVIIRSNAQVTAIGGRIIAMNILPLSSAIGAGGVVYSNVAKPEGATLSIGSDAKVTAIVSEGNLAIDNKGDITAPDGEIVAKIIDISFKKTIEARTIVELMQNGEVLYSTTNTNSMTKVAYTGLEPNTDYQVQMQYPNQTSPAIKHGVIAGETEEKNAFNTVDRKITNVTIINEVETYFMIIDDMLNVWHTIEDRLKAITDSSDVLSIGEGLEIVNPSKEDLTSFGKNYTIGGVLIKASLYENDETVKFYMYGYENDRKRSTPNMNLADVADKVIYISDYENYDSQTVDPSTLIKELRYNVNIDYPNENGVNGQNIVSDTVYVGTDVRQFATTQSRYKDYSFNAFDGGSTILDREITLTATGTDKTYNLSLPVETLESSYPNLYSNATLEALSDTLIYAISVDGSQTVYNVYDNTYSGFETQYTANMAYGKTVWIKAPQTVTSGEFVGWYNIDEQMFVSYENEYKFIMTQNTKLVPIYNDNTKVPVSETPYAVSENALYETYVNSDGVKKIRFTTPITYFPQNIDGASLKIRYQVAYNDEACDLNGTWVGNTDVTLNVNAENRINYYLTADYYNLDGSNNEMTIYIQPYVEYNNGTEIVNTKLDENAIKTLKYEYPVY